MWNKLLDLIPKVFTLMQRLERQENRLEQQQTEIKELYEMVRNLIYEQQRMRDEVHDQAERQAERQVYERKLLLQEIEIRVLREQQQLPPRSAQNNDNQDGE